MLLACVLRCARGVLQYRAAAAGVHPTEACPALLSMLARARHTGLCCSNAAVPWALCLLYPAPPYLTEQGSLYRGLCCAVMSGFG